MYIPIKENHFQYLNTDCNYLMPWKYPDRFYMLSTIEIDGQSYYVDNKVKDHLQQCYEIIEDFKYICEVNKIDWESFLENQE